MRCNAYQQRIFGGRVTVVGDTLDHATRTVKARGILDNPNHLLKAEMYVDVEVADPARRPAYARRTWASSVRSPAVLSAGCGASRV